MWTRGILIVLLLAGALAGYSYCSAPKSSQTLKVYVIFQEDEGRVLLEKFKQATGQPYEMIRMSSGEAGYHLLSMNKTGTDVVLGGPADLHEQLKNSGKLIRYASPMRSEIPAAYKDKDGYWTGMYMGVLAIGVNQTVWNRDPQLASLPLPQRLEDLLRPELRGKIDIPDPETSGTGYTLLASLAQQRGEDEAVRLVKALKKQSQSTSFAGFVSAQRLAAGDVAAVVNFLGDQLRFTNSGYAIRSFIPPQAGWEIGAVSILNSGNNTAAAKKLVDFVLSRNTQTEYMNTAFSFPVLPNIDVHPLLSSVDLDHMFHSYRFDVAARHRETLLGKWRSVKE
ncbi:extracellular solute-binding protein [Paenibacillus thermoaerophilus]|uniref:Extracellular solute-binding protein n=1 Tax=Paenibacillus thermoaerophilus TaxID=1215385 RepID=A0ABW2V751_9BACL|nr:extracellular solute-binding protein [Paenibacillus thermoaerophilus]TMV16194.1 extracellular solute-binding protein [Paenibacillus thermoaerophilus]